MGQHAAQERRGIRAPGRAMTTGGFSAMEMGESVAKAIDTLPSDMRAMVVMRFWEELSYEEIAQLKNMPLGTVKNKLFRGRQMLKSKLAQYLVD